MPTSKAGTLAAHKESPGFSIVELLVVLAVIGLIAAMVAPRIGALDGVQLRSAARSLVGTVRITYNTAIANRLPYRIAFDLENHEYWVEEKMDDEYMESTGQLLGRRTIPDNLYIKSVIVMDRECVSWCKEYLYFSPGGYVEEAAIQFATNDESQVVSVFTRPMTGRAVIVLEEMTREEWEEYEENP